MTSRLSLHYHHIPSGLDLFKMSTYSPRDTSNHLPGLTLPGEASTGSEREQTDKKEALTTITVYGLPAFTSILH